MSGHEDLVRSLPERVDLNEMLKEYEGVFRKECIEAAFEQGVHIERFDCSICHRQDTCSRYKKAQLLAFCLEADRK